MRAVRFAATLGFALDPATEAAIPAALDVFARVSRERVRVELVKLLAAMRGRPVEGSETAELLEPYGEWAGLASVYLLHGYARGLLPLPKAA